MQANSPKVDTLNDSLLVTCKVIATLSGASALSFFITNDGSGFLGNLGYLLSLGCLLAGAVLTWPLLLTVLLRGNAPTWSKFAFWLVTPVILVLLARLLVSITDDWQQERIEAQREAVESAVVADDIATFDRAFATCGDDCREKSLGDETYGAAYWLFRASAKQSKNVARHLLGPAYKVRAADASSHYQFRATLCDGREVEVANAMTAAVANNDRSMLDLLLPSTDNDANRQAMWLAAKLDRLELMQRMHATGVRLDWGGELYDENETLVVAAASGAALRVARWLLEDQSIPAQSFNPHYPRGHSVLWTFWRGMRETGDLRNPQKRSQAKAFVQLLLQHGSEIDEKFDYDEPSALSEAARVSDRPWANLLIELGADPGRLSVERRAELKTLLDSQAEPYTPPEKPEQSCRS